MIVYVDNEYKCHIDYNDSMTAIDVEFFDNKCKEFIEGYCCDISEGCVKVYPWKRYSELAAAQAEYEHDLLEELRNVGITIEQKPQSDPKKGYKWIPTQAEACGSISWKEVKI